MTTAGVGGPSVRRAAGTFRSALGHRRFRWLISHHLASAIAQTLGTVAIVSVVWDRTHSKSLVSLAAIARLLPYLLVSGFAGVLADRFRRDRVLFWSTASRAILATVLTLAVVADAPAGVLIALTFAITICGTPCYPALAASVPQVVPTGDLVPANGLLTTVESAAFIVGPALGGAVLLAGPAWLVLAVDAVVFVIALFCLIPVGPLPAGAPSAVGAAPAEPWFGAFVAGLRTAAGSGDVAAPLLLVVVVNLVYGGSLVGLVVVADELLGTGKSGFGTLNAALGAGAFVGVLVANRFASTPNPLRVVAFATLATGLPFAALAGTDVAAVAVGLMVISGVGSIVTEVVAITLIQRAVPSAMTARVFGILDMLVVGAILTGSALAPVMIDLFGVRWSVVVVGAVVPLAACIGASRLRALGQRAELRRLALAERIELLGLVPFLADAPEPTLEALASAAHVEKMPAGTVLIREGDLPDDFYVVVSGAFVVSRAPAEGALEVLATTGRGAGLGEIGLLEGVPRTATVIAHADAEVLRIHGTVFLDAVNGASPLSTGTPGGGYVARVAQAAEQGED